MAFTFVLCQSVPLTYLPLPHTHTHHHRLHLHYHCSVYPQFLLASYLPACTGTARQFPCVGGNGWRPVSNAYGVIKSKLGFHPHATFEIENSPEMCGRNILPSSFATILLNFAPPCALCFILLIFPCFHSESVSRLLLPRKGRKDTVNFWQMPPPPQQSIIVLLFLLFVVPHTLQNSRGIVWIEENRELPPFQGPTHLLPFPCRETKI